MSKMDAVLGASAGQIIEVAPDWWMLTDAVPEELINLLPEIKPTDPKRVVVFIDHDTPCGSSEVAAVQRKLIDFAQKHGCRLYNGRGIGYQLMMDNHVKAGEVIACCGNRAAVFGAVEALGVSLPPSQMARSLQGAPVQITAQKAVEIELISLPVYPVTSKDIALALLARPGDLPSGASVTFTGPGAQLPRHERISLAGMLSVAGTLSISFGGDPAAPSMRLDPADMNPVITGPNTLTDARQADELAGRAVNEVFIGGCTGGRIEDLRLAAGLLKGKHTPGRMRLMIAPATDAIFRQASDERLIADLLDAGALVMNQGCSVCWGKSQGLIDKEETLLSTGSYCHNGCAGEEGAQVYLCSVPTAVASALAGVVSSPKVEVKI